MTDSTAIGGIHYEVDSKTDGMIRAARDVDRTTKQMEKDFDRVDSSLSRVAAGVKRAVAAMATITIAGGAIRRVITDTANFDRAMGRLQAVSGSTADQMKALEKQARELGATTQYSAQQAAEAQAFFAQAGFKANDILASTPGILKLATAGSLDLARAADIASNVLGGMRLEVNQLGRVNDVLASTASNANTNVDQLGQAFVDSASFAAGAGVSIENVSAAIGILSNNGVQAGRAGTGLRGVMAGLAKLTPEAEKALAKYGLTAGDVSVETHGFNKVLATLQKAGLSNADAIQIFGREAANAAGILIDGAQKVADFTKELNGAEGAADKMAAIIGDDLAGSIDTFNSALSESILKLGKGGVGGAFEYLIQVASGVLSSYNGMLDAFLEHNDVSNTQIALIHGVSDGLKVLAAILAGRLVGSLASATGGFLAARLEAMRYQAALASMAGLSRTAAAGQVALAAATRGAVTAMSFVGGPAGVAVLAAAAVFEYGRKLDEAVGPADRLKQATAALRNELGLLTEQQIQDRLTANAIEMSEQYANMVDAQKKITQLREKADEGSRNRRPMTPGAGGFITPATESVAEIRKYENQVDEVTKSQAELTKQSELLRDRLEEVRKVGDKPADLPANTPIDISDTKKKKSKYSEANDPLQRLLELRRQYGDLIGQQNTDEEKSLATLKERLALIDRAEAAGVGGDYDDQRRRAVNNAFDSKPKQLTGGEYDNQAARYQQDAETEQERYDKQMAALVAAREEQLITQQDYDRKEEDFAQQHADRLMQIEQARQSFMLSTAGDLFGSLAGLSEAFAGKQSGIYRAMFAVSKAFAIADAAIKIQQGIANAAALPFPVNLGAMATVAASTASIVSTISSVSMGSGRAHGGPASASTLRRVGEGGKPEIFNDGTSSYLLPGSNGQVFSNRDMMAGAQSYLSPRSSSGGGRSGIGMTQQTNVTFHISGNPDESTLEQMRQMAEQAADEGASRAYSRLALEIEENSGIGQRINNGGPR